jgi:hypothetical protein
MFLFKVEYSFARYDVLLFSIDRFFPAADFQLVAIGIVEKAGVIALTVARTELRAFQIFPADFAHQFRQPINLGPAIGPEGDAGAVGAMASILAESKERFRLVPAGGKEDSQSSARAVANKPQRREQFTVKLLRALQIADAQVNVIEVSCLFHFLRRFSIRTANCLHQLG